MASTNLREEISPFMKIILEHEAQEKIAQQEAARPQEAQQANAPEEALIFTRFSEFPVEVQEMIWEDAIHAEIEEAINNWITSPIHFNIHTPQFYYSILHARYKHAVSLSQSRPQRQISTVNHESDNRVAHPCSQHTKIYLAALERNHLARLAQANTQSIFRGPRYPNVTLPASAKKFLRVCHQSYYAFHRICYLKVSASSLGVPSQISYTYFPRSGQVSGTPSPSDDDAREEKELHNFPHIRWLPTDLQIKIYQYAIEHIRTATAKVSLFQLSWEDAN